MEKGVPWGSFWKIHNGQWRSCLSTCKWKHRSLWLSLVIWCFQKIYRSQNTPSCIRNHNVKYNSSERLNIESVIVVRNRSFTVWCCNKMRSTYTREVLLAPPCIYCGLLCACSRLGANVCCAALVLVFPYLTFSLISIDFIRTLFIDQSEACALQMYMLKKAWHNSHISIIETVSIEPSDKWFHDNINCQGAW